MPDLNAAISAGLIWEVMSWAHDMEPAKQRFHRGYWLAANRRPLGGLLNRAIQKQVPMEVDGEISYVCVEEEGVRDLAGGEGDEVVVTEEDVGNEGVEVGVEEARRIWARCREEAWAKDAYVTGCSEWEE